MRDRQSDPVWEEAGLVNGRRVPWVAVALVLIFVFGCCVRLINLGHMSYHHDESIHAYYSWRLCEKGPYSSEIKGDPSMYDPVYHGPFLYHATALSFLLFGDSDYTGRLPMALFGVLMIVFVYQLHHLIGRRRALIAAGFVAISPSLTYFSRFARNDIFIGTDTIGVILFALLYFKEKAPGRRLLYFLAMTLTFTLLYCTKENSYIVGGILCGFLVLYGVVRIVWGAVENRPFWIAIWLGYTAGLALAAVLAVSAGTAGYLVGLLVVIGCIIGAYLANDSRKDDESSGFSAAQGFLASVAVGLCEAGILAWALGHRAYMVAGAVYAVLLFGVAGLVIVSAMFLTEEDAKPEWSKPVRRFFHNRFEFVALVAIYGIFSAIAFSSQAVPLSARAEFLKNDPDSISRSDATNEYNKWFKYGSNDSSIRDGKFADPEYRMHPKFKKRMLWGGIGLGILTLLLLNFIRLSVGGDQSDMAGGLSGPESGGAKPAKDGPKEGASPRGSPRWEEAGSQDGLLATLTANVRLLLAVAICVGVFWFFFTTMFAHTRGLVDGVTNYVRYWYAQKYKPRIAQPNLGKLYFLFPLITYEIAPLVLGLIAAVYYSIRLILKFVGAAFSVRLDRSPAKGEPSFVLPIFFTVWTVVTLFLYANLHERVPWLLVHQTLPLAVLAGYFLGELLDRFKNRIIRVVVIGVSSTLALFVFRSNMMLLQHLDDAREIIVYVQSNENIRKIAREVDEIAFESGSGSNVDKIRRANVQPITIGIAQWDGNPGWPLNWYFRNYITSTMISKNYMVNIGNPGTIADDKLALGNQFEYTIYGFREHWSTDSDPSRPGKRFSKEWWRNHLKYFFYRYPWSSTGAPNLAFYRKRQIREAINISAEYIEGFDQLSSYVQPVKSWGAQGSGEGQFRVPRGIAVAPDGSVYVADSLNLRVQKFSPDGEFLLQFGGRSPSEGQGNGLFTEKYGIGPCGVAVDRDGMVYVTDTWGGRIQKFDSEGRYVGSILPGPNRNFFGPRDVAVGADGLIYVSDTGNKDVKVFEPDGRYVRSIGRSGTGPGQFNEQVGICITPEGNILVADTGNQRIQDLNSRGTLDKKLQVFGWQVDTASIPHVEPYVAKGDDGTVYVTDSTRHAVFQIAPDWKSVLVWGNKSDFRKPTGIAVSPDGFIYVVDSEGCKVLKFKKQ